MQVDPEHQEWLAVEHAKFARKLIRTLRHVELQGVHEPSGVMTEGHHASVMQKTCFIQYTESIDLLLLTVSYAQERTHK